MRAVLEAGGECLSKLMFAITTGHDEVRRGELSANTRREVDTLEKQAVLESNRIGVRLGPKADQYTTFRDRVVTILDESDDNGLDREQSRAYSRAWTELLAAETAYLDATANTLGWDKQSVRSSGRRIGRRASD